MTQAPDDKRTIILDAALRVFGDKGYYETKVADIAEEAAIAKGTTYLYFSSKEELFRAMMVREFDLYEQQSDLIIDKEDLSFGDKIRKLSEMQLLYFFNRRNWGRMFAEHPNNDKEFHVHLCAFIHHFLEKVTRLMAASGIQQPWLAAQSFTGIQEAFKREIMMDPNSTLEMLYERVDYVTDLFVRQVK